MHRGI